MDELPLWLALAGLVVLLLVSAFFSVSETALMALNRLRVRHLVREGDRSAARVQSLLERTDRLLGTILLGNNLVNAAATALVTFLAIRLVGDNEWALLAATATITFLILVFAEITPKVVGAAYPERIAFPASRVLLVLLAAFRPIVWFVNLFVKSLLWLLRVRPPSGEAAAHPLSVGELRTLVLEGGNFIPGKHRSILLNLFELQELSVDDVMTPRARVEGIDLQQSHAAVLEQLRTCYHNKLPAYEGDINRTVGILPVRRLLSHLAGDAFSLDTLRSVLTPVYYIPSGTPLFQQLQSFQDYRQRIGLVVDEYGEVRGVVTLEDIIEEIVGDIADEHDVEEPDGIERLPEGGVEVDGSVPIRDLNRALDWDLPDEEANTIAGLVIHEAQSIPSPGQAFDFHGFRFEVLDREHNRLTRLRVRPIA